MNIYTTVTSKLRHHFSFLFVLLFMLILTSITYAKNTLIPSRSVILAKKKIYNKNVRFYWDSQKNRIQIKRKNKTMQYINFGVNPSIVEIIDVNFDGYGDMAVKIPENISGEYDKNGPREHTFYYLYDREKKKFIYHKKLTNVVYEADVYGMQIRGYAFDAKKKVLHTFDMEDFYYGGNVYVFKNKRLVLKTKGFRLVPSYYPDGVDVEYRYKNGKIAKIKVLQDGGGKKRKSVNMNVTLPKSLDSKEKIKLPDINATLEKTLVNSLHALFENHQIETFNQTHFYNRYEMGKESDLMNVAIMLDTLFRTDVARTKEDTLFALIEKFSNIKKLNIDKFIYDKVRGFYELDVRLHFKNSVEKYQWHFFKKGKLPYSKKGIYFLPIAYDEKHEGYLLLNENFIFDYEGHDLRIVHKKNVLQVLTFWEYKKGKKGWFTSERVCRSKYIEFNLYDYTADGNLEWLVSCRNKLQNKRSNEYHLRYGGKLLFNAMSVVNANSYTWNEKQRRFVFSYKGFPRNSYKVFHLVKSSDDNRTYFKRGIGDMYWQVETKGAGSQYVTTYGEKIYANKERFEKSFHGDTIDFKEARPRVQKGTKLYFDIEDIKKNKIAFILDENTPIIPMKNEILVNYWDKNVSKTEPAMYLINVIYNKRTYWMDSSKLKKEGVK